MGGDVGLKEIFVEENKKEKKALYSLSSIHNSVDVHSVYTLLNPNPHFKVVGSAILTTNISLDREMNSYHKLLVETKFPASSQTIRTEINVKVSNGETSAQTVVKIVLLDPYS